MNDENIFTLSIIFITKIMQLVNSLRPSDAYVRR